MPMNLPGRDVAAASRVMEIDDVFVARMTSGRASASTCFRILTLSSSFSVAASMTRSQPPSAS